MRSFLTRALLVAALFLFSQVPARAQYIQVYSPPVVVAPAPVVSYSYYPPVTPVVNAYYAPAARYAYYPPTTVYSAPAAVVTPATVVTQRTFVGLGIFRPRGVYTQTYYTPAAVVTPSTSYYAPVYVR